MTERLYYTDSHLRAFDASILSCTEADRGFAVVLDRTAFFPEGGGQKGDTGTLSGVTVRDTRESDGSIVHYCAAPLPVGETVHGVLDWETRFSRMQSHSGEHIVSGLAHQLWGCENVGFHMAEESVTLDFDRELSSEQVRQLEERANAAIWENIPITASFPGAALSTLEYRQKKPLAGEIRIVEIEGIDRCACCAPHVSHTGEVGSIRLLDAMRHRGGIRLTMLAGGNAYRYTARQGQSADELSRLFSAPKEGLVGAAERILAELEREKNAHAETEREYMAHLGRELPETEGNTVLFLPADRSAGALRELAGAGADKSGGLCAVFAGSDGEGWKYVILSRHLDLRAGSRAINAGIGGRGGGSREMIQGSASASREAITAFLEAWHG